MRASEEYQRQVSEELETWRGLDEHEHQATAEAQASLAKEFMLEGTVGDQDWLTLLAWKQPQLVHLLPCQFNVQTDQVPDLANFKQKV